MSGSPCVSYFFRQQLPLFHDVCAKRAYSQKTCSNGVRLARMQATCPGNQLGLYFKAGSANEALENNGNFYVFQRLLANDERVRKLVQRTGVIISSKVGREVSGWQFNCLPEDSKDVLTTMTDVIKNPNLTGAAEYAAKLADAELTEQQNHIDRLYQHLHEQCYQFHPLGLSPWGSIEGLGTVNEDTVQTYVQRNLVGKNAVIVGVTDLEEAALTAAAEEAAKNLTPGTEQEDQYNRYFGGIQSEDNPYAPFKVWTCAFRTNGYAQEDLLPISIWKHLWSPWRVEDGAATSSRIGRVLAFYGPEWDATYVKPFQYNYRSTGLVGIEVGHNIKPRSWDTQVTIATAYKYTVREMINQTQSLEQEEMDKAKSQYKAEIMNIRDSPNKLVDHIADNVLQLDDYPFKDLDEFFAEVNKVTLDQFMDVGVEYLYDQDAAYSGVGNVGEHPPYGEMMRHWTRLWRL